MRPGPPGMYQDVIDDRANSVRRVVIVFIIAFVLLSPARSLLHGQLTGTKWFLLAGSVVLTALVLRRVMTGRIGDQIPDFRDQSLHGFDVLAIVALGIALFAAGGINWLGTLAIAAAMIGRFSRTAGPAIAGSLACVAAGLTVATNHNYGSGNLFAVVFTPPLAALFAYSASRRAETVDELRRTRAELARAAVAEERLRIARDLHDLLGHSLSLITLKAELAGRVIGSDPGRAAAEIAELESVARRSLSEVREAVAGFRQPDLAGELAGARQLLDAAGIASDISSADSGELPQKVDAALAWAVREGATNVVRHSRATKVAITVSTGPVSAMAEIRDNGPAAVDHAGPAGGPGGPMTAGPEGRATVRHARPAVGGSGLPGLAERVRDLGGELAAGTTEPHGFLLRVVVPLSPPA